MTGTLYGMRLTLIGKTLVVPINYVVNYLVCGMGEM